MRVRLRNIRQEAEEINSYLLEALPGESLPEVEPGAHIDVQIKAGLVRSYSLVNDPGRRQSYEIAVHHAKDSRGGSRYIHEHWKVGNVIEISTPQNNFPLVEDAAHTVLIAGGIGITPMLPMIARLEKLGRRWELHYVAATPGRAAYVDRLIDFPQAKVVFDGVHAGQRLDLNAVCDAAPCDAHLYCCGPAGMLDAFVALNKSRRQGHAHVEYFSAETDFAKAGGYTLELARTGKTITVNKGETILDALLSAGANVGFACSEGICGTCQVQVLGGIPDHRDHFLTEKDKESNKLIMVCCSGSKTPHLVLDL